VQLSLLVKAGGDARKSWSGGGSESVDEDGLL
jgi:hypothetical protein